MLLFTELWSSAGFVDISLNENKELVIFLKKRKITVRSALSFDRARSKSAADFSQNIKALCPLLYSDAVVHNLIA